MTLLQAVIFCERGWVHEPWPPRFTHSRYERHDHGQQLQVTVDRIADMTLGAFGNLRPFETLNSLIRRYLSTTATWSVANMVSLMVSFFSSAWSFKGCPTSMAERSLHLTSHRRTVNLEDQKYLEVAFSTRWPLL
jgi:hypothetical protein